MYSCLGAFAELTLVFDVIRVGVRPQDELGLDAPVLRGPLQRFEGSPGVDVEGHPAFLVSHQIGVREVARMHAPFDEHGGTLPATPAIRRN